MTGTTPIYQHPDGHQVIVGQGLITACTAEGIALSMPIGPDGLAALGAALLEHATTVAQDESERAGAIEQATDRHQIQGLVKKALAPLAALAAPQRLQGGAA